MNGVRFVQDIIDAAEQGPAQERLGVGRLRPGIQRVGADRAEELPEGQGRRRDERLRGDEQRDQSGITAMAFISIR